MACIERCSYLGISGFTVFTTYFIISVPQRCSGLVGTTEGVRLKAWSFGSSIPPPNPCPGSHKDRGCHFIFQARGFGNGEFNFWIETEVSSTLLLSALVKTSLLKKFLICLTHNNIIREI